MSVELTGVSHSAEPQECTRSSVLHALQAAKIPLPVNRDDSRAVEAFALSEVTGHLEDRWAELSRACFSRITGQPETSRARTANFRIADNPPRAQMPVLEH